MCYDNDIRALQQKQKKNRSALQVSSREKSVQGKLYRDNNA